MKFPLLYKRTSTGAIQFWEIETGEYDNIAWFETTYGQLGTDSPQRTTDYIEKGKNIGKKNETTPLQQAEAEALSKWEKQKKKGYVESKEAAEAGKTDKLIEGGIVPMLAHKFTDHGHKIKYPCWVQPKLDGIRCIAILENGECTLWSRTRKQITSMPHIIAEIEKLNLTSYDCFILDGELYNHAFKSHPATTEQVPEGEITVTGQQKGFEHIVSLVRQEEPDPNHTDVEFHIYDYVDDKNDFNGRWRWLQGAWKSISNDAKYLKLVQTSPVLNEDEVPRYFDTFRKLGYEGCMLRNGEGKYVNKRSYDLLKVKGFDDNEFDIIGIEEGRGKLQGHVGAFVCSTTDGKEFLAKMSGDTGKLKEYFENHSLWKGKRLTVKYQGLTGTASVPRFPVGVSIRDYE